MPAANDNPDLEAHDRQVRAIAEATAKLLLRFGPGGFTPEAIFEGAVKGGASQLIAARGLEPGEVAELLQEMGRGFATLPSDPAARN